MPMAIGHTRFSLFSPDFEGWKASNGSVYRNQEEYKTALFDDSRLEPRAELFLNYTIPILLDAPKNIIYRHVISYSPELPHKYRVMLNELASKHPEIVLDEQIDRVPSISFEEVALRELDKSDSFAVFRLDDDDVLARNFFTQLENYVRPEFVNMKISFGLGCTAIYDSGQIRMVRSNHQPMIAIGLASICGWTPEGGLIEPPTTAHNKSDRYCPLIVDSRKPTYLWLRHIGQDTNVGDSASTESIQPLVRLVSNKPRLGPDVNVSELFPQLSEKIDFRHKLGALIDQPSTLLDPLHFELERSLRTLSLRLRGHFDSKPAGEHNLLIAYGLIDSAGSLIKEGREDIPLVLSPNPEIGWYHYFAEEDQTVDRTWRIELPEGVSCKSLTVFRWHEKDKRFVIEGFECNDGS